MYKLPLCTRKYTMIVSNSLRKKGGIFIKKINIFLMIIFSMFFINNINVHAETANFYEAEYIDGIYMNKYQYSTKTIYYQKARFFRKVGTNEFAYCIEPFSFFNANNSYETTITPYNLTTEQKNHISKIAYFGYGYKNHTDIKWYAITQFMIWQAADSSGDYYFTDSLNGNRVNYYQSEINEINNLINSYNILPTITNKTFTTVEEHTLTIEDDNNIISNYQTDNSNLKIHGNKITINPLKEGTYNFNIYRNESYYQKPLIFYQSNNSQNLMENGNLNKLEANFKLNVLKTSIIINKIDHDTMSIIPSGEAILDGAKYMLYDESMNEIKELEIKDNQALIENINFGKYYLKEITPGIGYTLDDKTYEINITKENNNVELILENTVIKKKIIIEKKYGENNNFNSEKDIEFEIYNHNNELVTTISTNENGIAEIILPYGIYTIIQKNTTPGYNKIDPFKININNDIEETIELKDYKIPVPNTHTNKSRTLILLILQLISLLIC